MSTLAFFSLGTGEIIALVVVALLIFGRRLPEVAKSVGQSVVQFKKGLSEVETSVRDSGTDSKRLESGKDDTVAHEDTPQAAKPVEHKQA